MILLTTAVKLNVPTEKHFRVAEADEAAGFARCACVDTAQAFHCELYIPDATGRDEVRLQVGDLISGSLRGAAITGTRLLDRAKPPPALVASLTALADALAPYELRLPIPLESLADQTWRRRKRGAAQDATETVEGLVAAQLTFLFNRNDHPFDDRTLTPRLVTAMRRHNIQIDITEHLDENGDIQGFQILPSGPLLPFGEAGDWEQPAACYQPLVDFANGVLTKGGHKPRWHKVVDNFLLADPSLLELLVAHQIVSQ